MAGSAGNGMTDTTVDSICSRLVSSAKVAPTVASGPWASLIACTAAPSPAACAAIESATAEGELECQFPVTPALTAVSRSRFPRASDPTGSAAKSRIRADIPS